MKIKGLKDVKMCFSFLNRHKYSYWFLNCGHLITNYVSQISLALLNKNVINSIMSAKFENFNIIIYSAAFIILLNTLGILLGYFRMYKIRQIMYDLRVNLFKHMEGLTISYFEKNHSGDSIFRLNSNVEVMKNAYTVYSQSIIKGFVGGIISCIFILIIDWRLGLISICACGLTVLINMKFAPVLRRLGSKIQTSQSALVSRLSDMLAGIKIIKMYRNSETATKRYEEQNEHTSNLLVKRVSKAAQVDATNNILGFINISALIAAGAVLSALGLSDLGTVFAILSIQDSVSALFSSFGYAWGMMQESIAAAEMIQEVFDAKPEVSPHSEKETLSAQSDIAVRLENVVFSYDDENKVLDDVSITVKRGETVALAGSSGGGKSTVIKLIPHFYGIQSGNIYINGINIKKYPLAELRKNIAYVPQDSYLFEETIMENIRFGKPDATDEEVMKAAKLANAHEFISELPNGYDAITGDRGETLSGGQRQRISIARAFLKDAPILLLDEATSALDNENERLVQQSLERLMQNRTTLVVAHRLSTIENADVIYVLKNGKVIQSGTHKELSECEGVYNELVALSEKASVS